MSFKLPVLQQTSVQLRNRTLLWACAGYCDRLDVHASLQCSMMLAFPTKKLSTAQTDKGRPAAASPSESLSSAHEEVWATFAENCRWQSIEPCVQTDRIVLLHCKCFCSALENRAGGVQKKVCQKLHHHVVFRGFTWRQQPIQH